MGAGDWFDRIWGAAGDVYDATRPAPAGYHYEWGVGYVPNSAAYNPLFMWAVIILVVVLLLKK